MLDNEVKELFKRNSICSRKVSDFYHILSADTIFFSFQIPFL